MHDEPRHKLRELIVEYGRSLCDDPRRCEALLKDYCGQYKREIFVLVSALRNRVAEELIHASAGVPPALLLGRLIQRLEDELGLAENAARWAVESWALALGVIVQPLPVVKPTLIPPPSSPPIVAKVAPTPPPPVAETLMAGRYRDNGDGTVTDMQTGLQWMRFSLGQKWKGRNCKGEAKMYTWQEALDAASALNRQRGYAGYGDWRVPTIEELRTLVYCSSGQPKTWNDTGKPCEGDDERPTIYQTAFPNTLPEWFWSASPFAPFAGYAWGVYFRNGLDSAYDWGNYGAVRLVRRGL